MNARVGTRGHPSYNVTLGLFQRPRNIPSGIIERHTIVTAMAGEERHVSSFGLKNGIMIKAAIVTTAVAN